MYYNNDDLKTPALLLDDWNLTMLPSSTSPRSKPPYLQDQPALGHALLAAVQLLDILTVQVTIGLIRRGAGLTDVLMHN